MLGTGSVCACGGGFDAVSASASVGASTRVVHLLLLLTYGKGGATWLCMESCDRLGVCVDIGTARHLPKASSHVRLRA